MLGALALMGAGFAAKSGLDWVKGNINNSAYADRIRDQAELQYLLAERYAKNSPSWNIEGLRSAGLNPILAVSNGVNLGANVPNLSASSPDTDSGSAPDLAGAYNNAQRLDIERDNAETSRLGADASMIQAKASLLKAQSEAALNSARVRDIQVDTLHKQQGGGYRTGFVSDFVRSGVKASESLNKLHEMQDDLFREAAKPYIQHSPSSRFVNPDLKPYDGSDKLKRIPREDDSKRRKFDWRRPVNWLPPTIGF